MPSVHTLFPSTYVRALDLGSHRVPVTISHLKTIDVGGDGELKPVVFFTGKDKGLVLNRTNATSIAEISGTDDYAKWAGVRIVLFVDQTTYKGKACDCIRVARPAGARPEPEPEPDLEVPVGDDSCSF